MTFFLQTLRLQAGCPILFSEGTTSALKKDSSQPSEKLSIFWGNSYQNKQMMSFIKVFRRVSLYQLPLLPLLLRYIVSSPKPSEHFHFFIPTTNLNSYPLTFSQQIMEFRTSSHWKKFKFFAKFLQYHQEISMQNIATQSINLHKKTHETLEMHSEDRSVVQLRKIIQKQEQSKKEERNGKQLQINFEDISQIKEQTSSNCQHPPFSMLLFVSVFITEIGVQTALLILQYIFSKLPLNLFCALLVVTIFLHVLSILAFKKAKQAAFIALHQITPQQILEHNLFELSENQKFPFPSQTNHTPDTDKQKTKKLKHTFIQPHSQTCNIETIKKLNCKQPIAHHSNHQSERQIRTIRQTTKLFLIAKTVQNIYAFALVSISLGINENPTVQGFDYIICLLLICYGLILASSSLAVYLFCLMEEVKNIPEQKKQTNCDQIKEILTEGKELSKPPTSLSIQQHIQPQTNELQNTPNEPFQAKRQCHHVEDELKQPSIKQQFFLPHDDQNVLQELSKHKKAKSVLKHFQSFKNHEEQQKQEKIQEEQDDDFADKKKVQINVKTIQYFEYDRSSVNSSRCKENEISQNKSRCSEKQKSKFSPINKYAYIKNIHDANLLQKKQKSEIRKKSKSEGKPNSPQKPSRFNEPRSPQFQDYNS